MITGSIYDFDSKDLGKPYTGIRGVIRITTEHDRLCSVKFFRSIKTQHKYISIDLDLNIISCNIKLEECVIERLKTFIRVNKVKLVEYWDNGFTWNDKESEEFFRTLKVHPIEFETFEHRYMKYEGEIEFDCLNLESKTTGISGVYIRIMTQDSECEDFKISVFSNLRKFECELIVDSNLNVLKDSLHLGTNKTLEIFKFITVNKVKLENFWKYGIQWESNKTFEFCDTLKISKVELK